MSHVTPAVMNFFTSSLAACDIVIYTRKHNVCCEIWNYGLVPLIILKSMIHSLLFCDTVANTGVAANASSFLLVLGNPIGLNSGRVVRLVAHPC